MSSTNLELELNSLRTKLSVEIENDSRQLEIVKKRIEKNQALLTAVRNSLNATSPMGNRDAYGAKSEIIQNAINSLGDQFTQDDVEAAIRRMNPEMEINRNRIRASLWTLCKKFKRIRVVRKGSSRQAGIYAKTQEVAVPIISPNINGPEAQNHILTGAQLEDSVRERGGRISDLAKRLSAPPELIQGLLEPASRVYKAEAGWLKIRE